MKIVCDFSVFYLDKTDPKGSLVVECGKMLADNGYKIRVFNTVNFRKSMHYNPFHYIHSEKDIMKLVNTERSSIGHTVETVAAQQKYRKKAIQKKYAKQYRQERWQGFKNRIKKEVQKLISNPVGFIVGKGAGLGITLGIALGLILSLPSFLTIGGMVLGGAGIAMSTSYLAEEQEILAVEAAYSQRENVYVQSILHFSPAYDELELHDRGVSYSHDSHALAAWMTVLLGSYEYGTQETTAAMSRIFNAQYSYRIEYEVTTKKITGQNVPWNILKVYVDQKSLVDAAEDSLSDEDYERFKIIYDNRGGMPEIF